MKRRLFRKQDNRGSGVVTVLLGVVFLSAFGTLLLILSYTGYEMRSSDRKGKQTLYDASSVVEQLNAGIQDICSDAIVSAYADALVRYNDFGTSVTTEFQQRYRDFFLDWYGPYIDGGNIELPESRDPKGVLLDSETGTYNLNVLRAMIVEDEDGTFTIESTDPVKNAHNKGVALNLTAAIEDGVKPEPIVLQGLRVTFTKQGRTTTVLTDITIDYPSIGYQNNTYSETGINQNACIIKGNLIQNNGQGMCSINGGAYFGSADLTGSGSVMTLKNGRYITPGDIVVSGYNTVAGGNQRFVLENIDSADEDKITTLWARNIIVENDGAVMLSGDTRIANNLEVNGSGARVSISGNYFGFGPSEEDCDNASTILVNYRGQKTAPSSEKTVFNFDELQRLILSGRAFIKSGSIPTGESLSVRENQRVYLLPAEMVYYIYHNNRTQLLTNPEKMDTNKIQEIQNPTDEYPGDGFFIDFNSTVIGKKTAADYGITGVRISAENFPSSTNKMVYAFARFENDNLANEFFRDYYAANPEKIDGYMRRSINMTESRFGNPMVISKAIYPIENTQEIGYTPESEFEYYAGLAESYRAQYETLTSTLNIVETDPGEEEDNPLNYILSEDLSTLGGDDPYRVYFNSDGEIVAIAANGNVTIAHEYVAATNKDENVIKVQNSSGNWKYVQNASPDKVCLILSTGNIVVDGLDFDGLIVADGNLELRHSSNLNKNPISVSEAYSATASDGSNITNYLENQDSEDQKMGSAWAVTELVGYKNWKRTTDDE